MKKFITANIGLTALLGSGFAHAGLSPYYIGVGAGVTNNNGSSSNFCPTCNGSQYDTKKRNNAYKVYGGLNLTDTLAVEAELTDLGKTYELDMYRPDNGIPGNPAERAHATQKTRGIGISAKANRNLGRRTSVYGKVGAFAWENKNKMDYTNQVGISETYKTKDRGISPTLGVGIEHEITDRVSVRAGWDHYFNTGKGDQFLHLDSNQNFADLRSVKTDTDMIYVGATFNF
ncbi:MAG: outer membrane beta-barrel protein [Gammaproteobacteria bacterium]|nr:outer membrane beta-barrel protein [Gammaproteobacteria bacterium]MBU1723091.1 outer membrane beta-barrel protein [Gammaproteobacteria bacterium]MBU2007392.1 outer membrane beta-barrel protein [Gammaproteobacteria bacterium]